VKKLGFDDSGSLREVVDKIDELASLPHMTVSMVELSSHHFLYFLCFAPPGVIRYVPELVEVLKKLQLKGWLTSLEYVLSFHSSDGYPSIIIISAD
jgi:hypothetical protein